MKLKQNSLTAYDTLEEDLRRDISTRRLKEGQAIHTESELASLYGISRNTVRKALQNLVQEGLLKKIQGCGTFVLPQSERVPQIKSPEIKNRQIAFLAIATVLSEKTFRSAGTFEPIFDGLNRILQPKGYNLLFSHVGLDWTLPPCLVNHDVCGVIFHGKIQTEFWEANMKPFPAVGIQYVNEDLPCSWVKIDNFSRSYQAVSCLRKLGHRRIGFVSNESDFPIPRERFEGFVKSLSLLGLPVNPDWFFTWQRPTVDGVLLTEYEISDYWPRLEKAFRAAERPTALVCLDDWRALCTATALKKAGFRIPEDVSILGGFNEKRVFHGIFTGFRDRLSDICSEAARLLLEQLEGKTNIKNKTVLLRPELVPGESVAPPCC